MTENFTGSLFSSEGFELEIPPDDPTHHHFLKFCFVCQEEAKPEQVSIPSVAKKFYHYILSTGGPHYSRLWLFTPDFSLTLT